MEDYPTIQRRATKRIKISEPVRFQFKDPELFGACLSCDVSEGGIKMNLNRFIPLQEELDLSIKLKDDKNIGCRAKVIWIERFRFSERYRAGLQFIPTGDYFESKQAISELVRIS